MFGYIRTNPALMTEAEKLRYRAVYCGLCRQLGRRHGWSGKLALTYDMTFLCLLLASLYEPEETHGELRCVPHPGKKHAYAVSAVTDYAADMTVALVYHKCLDDWHDEHNHTRKLYADLLAKRYEDVSRRWPDKTKAIEACLQQLSEIEKQREAAPDAAAVCFGKLMGEMFAYGDEYWLPALRSFGESLGQFIYLTDAACDYDDDVRSGSYNPCVLMERKPEEMRELLTNVLGTASCVFEKLPLVSDEKILRNILYSGLWQSYNETMQKRKEGAQHGG